MHIYMQFTTFDILHVMYHDVIYLLVDERCSWYVLLPTGVTIPVSDEKYSVMCQWHLKGTYLQTCHHPHTGVNK